MRGRAGFIFGGPAASAAAMAAVDGAASPAASVVTPEGDPEGPAAGVPLAVALGVAAGVAVDAAAGTASAADAAALLPTSQITWPLSATTNQRPFASTYAAGRCSTSAHAQGGREVPVDLAPRRGSEGRRGRRARPRVVTVNRLRPTNSLRSSR